MQWIYEKNEDNFARFVLGRINAVSGRTLFGVNPSTTCHECLDNTAKKGEKKSKRNGYEN